MNARKTFGKLLVVSLFIMLFVLLLTLSTSAATHEVTTEAQLTDALTDAAAGDTINITADVTTTQLVINRSLTFSGNGTLTVGDINVVNNVDLKFGGSLKLVLNGSILYTNADAGGSLTIGDTVKCHFANKNAIEINGCSPTVTIQGSAEIVSNATAANMEIFNIVNGANPTIYVKDNVTFLTPDIPTDDKTLWGHAFRVGDTGGTTPASATIYIQGSTVEGDEGIDIDTARVFDIRKNSSATIEVSGTVNLNTDKGLIYSPSATKVSITFNENTNATLVAGNETFFSLTAASTTLKLNGNINASGNVYFIGLDGGITDPVIELKGHYILNTSNFLHIASVKKSESAEAVKIDVTGSISGKVSTFIYSDGSGTTPLDINIAADVNLNGNAVFVESSSTGLVDIDITAREGNTTDKFVLNGWRVFNFRANTNVDLCINTNEINATCSERVGYTTNAAGVKVEMLAPKATYKTGGTDHFVLCNGGVNGDVTLKFTGVASLTTPATLISFVGINSSNDVSFTMEMTDDCPAYSVAAAKAGDGKFKAVMDLSYNTTGNITVNMKGNYTFTGYTDFFTFYNPTGTVDIDLTGDFTYQGSGQFFYAEKITSGSVDLVGNFDLTANVAFWVTDSVSGLVSFNVNPREGNTTDGFKFYGWRLFNFRQNTNTKVVMNGTLYIESTQHMGYFEDIASFDWDVTSDSLYMRAVNGDNLYVFDFIDNGTATATVTIDIAAAGTVNTNGAFVWTKNKQNPSESKTLTVNLTGTGNGLAFTAGRLAEAWEGPALTLNAKNLTLGTISLQGSYSTNQVFENCSGTINMDGYLSAPQIHVKGGSVATVITSDITLSGLGDSTMQGGLLYSNGATGNVTISGTGKLNHKNGHGIELNGVSNTVTIQDSGSIISAATGNNRETFNIVNGANPTIYVKDNAKIETPNDKLGHAIRVGKNDDNDNQPANVNVYIQGSTVQGDAGVDLDVCRVVDIRNLSSATVEITGKVDINVWRGVIRANETSKAVHVTINGDVTMNGGTEEIFYLNAKDVSLNMTGDYTIDAAAGHFLSILGQSDDTEHIHVANLTGNFNISMTGCADSHSLFYVEATGSTLTKINVKSREGNTTDKLVFNGGRAFNFRNNTKVELSIDTNEIDATCSERLGYTTNTANSNITFDAPTQTYNTSGTDATMLFNGGSNGDVYVKFDGDVSVTTQGVNFFQVNKSNDATLVIEGDFDLTCRDNLAYIYTDITGNIKLDVNCVNLTLTSKRFCDITSGATLDIDIKATNGTLTGSEQMLKLEGITGSGTVDIGGSFTATGYTKIVYVTAGSIATTIGGSVQLTASGESIHYASAAAGSVTITGSASISSSHIMLEGSGKINLTISGTPTFNFTTKFNGIQHNATGDATIALSGVWSTNKTIYCSGGKKNITVSGADTVLGLGNSGFYASDAGCELIITVTDATITGSLSEGVFTGNNGGKITATLNNANITNTNKFFGSAHEASELTIIVNGGQYRSGDNFFNIINTSTGTLTVNSGNLISGKFFGYAKDTGKLNFTFNGGTFSVNDYFYQFDGAASGDIKYTANTVAVTCKNHHIVNFGSGKVNFTMTGGTVTAPSSFIWYENKDSNTPAENVVTITGGTHTGGNMNILKNTNVKITVGGNANLTFTAGWAFKYQGDVTGSVTLKDNAVITCSTYGFVSNDESQANFTLQDNASFTCTADSAVYYGCKNVTSTITISGGYLYGKDNALTVPGTATVTINLTGGTVEGGNNGLFFGGASKTTANISGGTIIAVNDPIDSDHTAGEGKQLVWNISGGTFRSTTTGYAVHLRCSKVTANITGGSFYAPLDAALHVNQGTANVYGGYFEAGKLCCARSDGNGVLNIYGGTFHYTGAISAGGMPVRSGTGSSVGNVNIYGGNYYTDGTGTIFCCMNGVSNLTIYGGFNAWGGRGLVESANTSSIKSSGHGIGDMWTYRSIQMATGAAVRIVEGSTGLRFKGIISAADYAHIASIADAGSISFGTVIAPADYAKQVKFFTKEALKAANLQYLDIVADDGLHQMADGSYEIWAALTNIKEENLDREFAAVCYVTYTVKGETVTTYATYRETKNARSIRQVARLALQDDGRYNSNQIEVLKTLAPTGKAPVIDLYLIAGQSNAAGSTHFSEAFLNSNQDFIDGYSNIYYSGTAAGGKDFASKNFVEVELVRAGFGGNKTTGMGAELGMAKALSQYYNPETGRTAAIVKYGYGGTALADSISGQNFPEGSWAPPSWLAENGKKDEYKSGGLYRAFVKQIESSISDYRAMGYDVNIVGAYWMQGESDRGNPARYAQMFEMWVNDLRADVYALTGDSADQKLPILVGEISYSYNPGDMHLNPAFITMQNALADSIENLYVINQSPLATANTRADTGHWSCDDMLLIGEMIATTALNELVLGANATKYEMPYLTGTPVAEVYDAEGSLIETYSSFSWAINTAPAGATVKLLDNLTIYGPLGINNPNKITVDGQNFMIDVKTDQGDAMKLIATDLVLKDFNIKSHATVWGTETVWGMQTYQNAKFIWNGGSFEAESIGIVMNDAAIGQLHNVTVSVRNGVEAHSAAIYMGKNNADIWVDNCTVTAYGKAEAIRAINGYITVSGNSVITGGTDTAYAISQRAEGGSGYLAIGDTVEVTGKILNNGTGYVTNEDVVELPSIEDTPAA